MKLDTIVVPLDGSVLAEGAVARVSEIAADSGAEVLLVRAVVAHAFPGADIIEAQVLVIRDAEAYLGEVETRMRALGVRRVRSAVWYGAAASAIVEAAEVNHAELIVMMTHGRTGLGRLVMGSVAESVLRGTSTPILLLRAPGAPIEKPVGSAAVTQSCAQ
jgi:nucleotide-binding universal stress UspA family protein